MPHPDYTSVIFSGGEQFKKTVEATIKAIHRLRGRKKVLAVVGSGHSGLTVASAVAYAANLDVIAVRQKPSAHDNRMLNGPDYDKSFNCIIIDDLIGSGETLSRIRKALAGSYGRKVHILGCVLYARPVEDYWQELFPKIKFEHASR